MRVSKVYTRLYDLDHLPEDKYFDESAEFLKDLFLGNPTVTVYSTDCYTIRYKGNNKIMYIPKEEE